MGPRVQEDTERSPVGPTPSPTGPRPLGEEEAPTQHEDDDEGNDNDNDNDYNPDDGFCSGYTDGGATCCSASFATCKALSVRPSKVQ